MQNLLAHQSWEIRDSLESFVRPLQAVSEPNRVRFADDVRPYEVELLEVEKPAVNPGPRVPAVVWHVVHFTCQRPFEV